MAESWDWSLRVFDHVDVHASDYRESVRFTDFNVSPTCSPTRAALMTGRHEFRNGVTHTILERERMTTNAVTIAQLLQGAGSATAFELCGPDKGSCRFAEARLEANRIRVETRPGEAPARVRYCWGDAPRCNLYDHDGLPAQPFEAAIK